MNTTDHQIEAIKEKVKLQPNEIFQADWKISDKIQIGYLNPFGIVTNIGMYYLYENLTDQEIQTIYDKLLPSFEVEFQVTGSFQIEVFPTNGEDTLTFFEKIKNEEYFVSMVPNGNVYDYNGNIVGKSQLSNVVDAEYNDFEMIM